MQKPDELCTARAFKNITCANSPLQSEAGCAITTSQRILAEKNAREAGWRGTWATTRLTDAKVDCATMLIDLPSKLSSTKGAGAAGTTDGALLGTMLEHWLGAAAVVFEP